MSAPIKLKSDPPCSGCGCLLSRCESYPPPVLKCCPDCLHLIGQVVSNGADS